MGGLIDTFESENVQLLKFENFYLKTTKKPGDFGFASQCDMKSNLHILLNTEDVPAF